MSTEDKVNLQRIKCPRCGCTQIRYRAEYATNVRYHDDVQCARCNRWYLLPPQKGKFAIKYGVLAKRSGLSKFGGAVAWARDHGKVMVFDTFEAANEQAAKWNAQTRSPHVTFKAEPYSE